MFHRALITRVQNDAAEMRRAIHAARLLADADRAWRPAGSAQGCADCLALPQPGLARK